MFPSKRDAIEQDFRLVLLFPDGAPPSSPGIRWSGCCRSVGEQSEYQSGGRRAGGQT